MQYALPMVCMYTFPRRGRAVGFDNLEAPWNECSRFQDHHCHYHCRPIINPTDAFLFLPLPSPPFPMFV